MTLGIPQKDANSSSLDTGTRVQSLYTHSASQSNQTRPVTPVSVALLIILSKSFYV